MSQTLPHMSVCRWCKSCGIDLFLSENPWVVDKAKAYCDTCTSSIVLHHGTKESILKERLAIKQEIRDHERELEDLRHEVRDLESQITNHEIQIKILRRQL